jgi:hypothetical protein
MPSVGSSSSVRCSSGAPAYASVAGGAELYALMYVCTGALVGLAARAQRRSARAAAADCLARDRGEAVGARLCRRPADEGTPSAARAGMRRDGLSLSPLVSSTALTAWFSTESDCGKSRES